MARIKIDDLPVTEDLTAEQEALLLGAGLKSFRPTLEGLEDRQLMAASINVAAGVMTIRGYGGPIRSRSPLRSPTSPPGVYRACG